MTLQSEDRVAHHLVRLLGTDQSLFFPIPEDPGLKRSVGAMMVHFGSIEISKAKAAIAAALTSEFGCVGGALVFTLVLVQLLGCPGREASSPGGQTKSPAPAPIAGAEGGARDSRRVPMPAFSGAVRDLVSRLRKEFGVPISFIEADAIAFVTVPAGDYTMDRLLETVEAAAHQYRHARVGGRLVLLPKDPKYLMRVGNVEIVGARRPDAADRYFAILRSRDPRFEDFTGAIVIGYAGSPVHSRRVSLSVEGAVLDHLVEMIGDDPRVVFTVFPIRGKHAIQFGMVVGDGIQPGG